MNLNISVHFNNANNIRCYTKLISKNRYLFVDEIYFGFYFLIFYNFMY